MAKVLVTVGMGRWPFDRLVDALTPLCEVHDVFAQTGTSRVRPPCPHRPFVGYGELRERIEDADVVITHAGNTVRLVQRTEKVPIVVARRGTLGEMGNDHQVAYLRAEEATAPVVAVWDVDDLPRVVAEHREREPVLLRERPLPPAVAPEQLVEVLQKVCDNGDGGRRANPNPFAKHPLRRYAFAWDVLHERRGRHLDLGCGQGEFLSVLAGSTELDCHGADPHAGYLDEAATSCPDVPFRHLRARGELPFADGEFSSVSLLDVLEHVPDERAFLRGVHRILAPGGLLVLTVPQRHPFSFLDPDNAKFRLPRLHRVVYSLRFGPDEFERRFVDLSNGLRGDMSVGKDEHTNYGRSDVLGLLSSTGFEPTVVDGANLFWRLLQTPALLTGGRLRRMLERAIYVDGTLFSSANLFVVARRLS